MNWDARRRVVRRNRRAESGCIAACLKAKQLGVGAARLHELAVRASFDQAPARDGDDVIRRLYGRERVRDQDCGAALSANALRCRGVSSEHRCRRGVEIRSWLSKHEERRTWSHHRWCEREALPSTPVQLGTTLEALAGGVFGCAGSWLTRSSAHFGHGVLRGVGVLVAVEVADTDDVADDELQGACLGTSPSVGRGIVAVQLADWRVGS